MKISSRDIVKLIEHHDMKSATKLLGRPYRINGLVVEGKHNGKLIDFPTANLKLDYPYVFPDFGVYMGYAEVDGLKYKAIINVGVHPTVGALAIPIIEVHIIDFSGNILLISRIRLAARKSREKKGFFSMYHIDNH